VLRKLPFGIVGGVLMVMLRRRAAYLSAAMESPQVRWSVGIKGRGGMGSKTTRTGSGEDIGIYNGKAEDQGEARD
jgi:hypothetical protein